MIYFKELVYSIVNLACLESIGQVSRLEIQLRVEVTVLSPNSTGQQAGNSSRVSML